MSASFSRVDSLGLVGAGAMATALVKSWLAAGLVEASAVTAADVLPERREAMQGLGIRAFAENAAAACNADVVLLAVKPPQIAEALSSIRAAIRSDALVISVAAGVPVQVIEAGLKQGVSVVRVMPNTPCLVGASATGISSGTNATQAQVDLVLRLFNAVGVAYLLPEKLLDAVTGLSGSGPAYIYLVIEALSDGGVAAGLPRDIATRFAAQTVLGAAQMVLQTQQHPTLLREMVTSPAGTTAAGLLALEESGVRAGLIKAVMSASNRSHELGLAAAQTVK